MIKLKKPIAVWLAATALLLTAGCGKDGNLTHKEQTKTASSAMINKTTLVCGTMALSDELKDAVITFNKTNMEYQIVLRDYGEEEDPVTKMNADIAAGNAPDIIDLVNIPVEQYAAKGLLEDLTPYFEKDSELAIEDVIDSVLEGMKTDGKLYYVAPRYTIWTLGGHARDVGDGNGWNFAECKSLLEQQEDDVRPFYYENKSDILYSILGNGLTDFVDWQTGECSFDSEEFRDILELCNKGSDEKTDYSRDGIRMIQEGKILFIEGQITLHEVFEQEKLYGEDINYIGYPNKEKMGSYFQFDTRIGMYSKSKGKAGAWEFIRTFMTKEYQGKQMKNSETPTRQDCLDMVIRALTTTERYTDEFGRIITPQSGSMGYENGTEIEITPITQKQVDKYCSLLNHTRKSGGSDSTMMRIIMEEVKPYFEGEKSLEQTTEIMQKRIRTYVNENRF
ncbi:MAG: extracellular solute-binding protein [Lachnospiraceae bacterium]|nr:extracellular solute-binding protein [Lachnospiraceae bacterium]